uniref:Uncharacterized protein n=1 Tax=Caenorhabditis tropicalis TaxID=1561998 RepID=A0A1I7ULG3_9PELO
MGKDTDTIHILTEDIEMMKLTKAQKVVKVNAKLIEYDTFIDSRLVEVRGKKNFKHPLLDLSRDLKEFLAKFDYLSYEEQIARWNRINNRFQEILEARSLERERRLAKFQIFGIEISLVF